MVGAHELGKVEGLPASDSLDCPPISKHSEWVRGFSLIYGEEQAPATPTLGALAGPGMLATPLVRASYEEEPTLREIRWPEAIWEAPAILEEPISEEPIPKPGFGDTPTPSVAFLRRHHGHPGFASSGAAQCRLWQLYAISLFDDGCLVVCPCSIFGPLWTGLAIDNEPLPTWT